jgi:hypothetical protein
MSCRARDDRRHRDRDLPGAGRCVWPAMVQRRPGGVAIFAAVLLQFAPFAQPASADVSENARNTQTASCATAARSLPSFVGAARSDSGLFRVDVFAQSAPLPVNQLVSLLLILKTNGDTAERFQLSDVSVDMLAHRHGMYTQPVIRPCAVNSATGLSGFIIEGIQLHMRGVWTLQFLARGVEASDQAQVDIRV